MLNAVPPVPEGAVSNRAAGARGVNNQRNGRRGQAVAPVGATPRTGTVFEGTDPAMKGFI